MYCPASILLNSKFVFITLHTRHDYLTIRHIPASEKANLLRYEVILFPFSRIRLTINKNGIAWLKMSNATFRIKKAILRWKHGRRI